MSSKVLGAIAMAVAVAVGVYFYEQQGEPLGGASGAGGLAQQLPSHIPADAIFYGLNFEPYPLDFVATGDPSWWQLAETLKQFDDTQEPKLEFLRDLAQRYIDSMQQGPEALKRDWGYDDTVVSAFYTVGLSPVLEMNTADSSKVYAQVKAAADKAGVTLSTETEGADTLHRVALDLDNLPLTLLLRESPGWVRIALELPADEATAAIIRGSALPLNSLAADDNLAQLQSLFSGNRDSLMRVNFQSLIASLTNPESSAGAMLKQALGEQGEALKDLQSEACRQEFGALTASVPHWSAAIDFDFDEQNGQRRVQSNFDSVLSILKADLARSVMNLNGVVPSFFDDDTFDPLYSLALGLDVAQLTPVLMDLHQRLTRTPYACKSLQQMQAQLKESNPAMLGIAMAMVSGIKGVSVSVNDLELGDTPTDVKRASALISISAVSARQLLAMGQAFLPDLAQLQIPQDGSAVPLSLSMLPAGAPALKIAIKNDQHAVIMTDDAKALALAESFNTLSLDKRGFVATAFNFGDVIPLIGNTAKLASLSAAQCAEIELGLASYDATQAAMRFNSSFSDRGFSVSGAWRQVMPEPQKYLIKPGIYDAYYVGSGCELALDGSEEFKEDGRGTVRSMFAESECDDIAYESDYRWQQRGAGLYINTERERERADCVGAWGDWQAPEEGSEEESCLITRVTDDSFRCTYLSDEDSYSFVYKRQQGAKP